MALFRKPLPARVVLTAAASRIVDPSAPQSKSRAPDAEYLYSLYTKLGPVHSALRDKYFAASKITYYPGQIVDVDQDPEAVVDGPALEAFERLKGPQGDFAQFVAETVLHWDVTGEAYLVGQMVNGLEEWDVWSSVEYMKYRNPTSALVMDAATELDQSDFILRCWRAHPMLREDPDSPLRAVVAACEQYVLYQDMLTALGRSRLVAPLQIIPSEIDFPETDDSGNPTSFGKWLMEAQGAAVADTSNPNRLAPITVESPAAFKDGWLTIDLARDLPEWVPGMIDSVLRQMAIGLDVPVGIFDSAGSFNHWTAWLEDDSLRLNYVDPPVLDVLDSFTRGYLWPTLQAPISEGGAGMGRDEAQSFVFWRDYSDLTSRSVTSADALAAWDAGIITAEAARRSIGFTEADAPEDDPESPPEPEVEEIPVQDEGQEIPVILAAATPSLAGIDQKLYTQLSEAGQAALDRALERAGAKVRTAVVDKAKDRQLASIIADVDMTLIPQTVGRDNMARLQLTEAELIPEGVFNRYATRARDLLEQGQADTHTTVEKLTAVPTEPKPEEPSWIDKAVAFLVAGITALATKRLFTPTLDPDPAETGEVGDTDIPAGMVFDSMTLAGGGTPGEVAQRGMATGNLGEVLIEDSGFVIVDRQWRVGAPRVPFEPHHALNGKLFQSYTDPALATPLSVSWLGVSFMFPGDHGGCVCTAEPIIEPLPEQPSEHAHMNVEAPPSYVNPRLSTTELSVAKVGEAMSPAQLRAAQEAFQTINRRWPGAVAELQEITVSDDITAFATKSRWSIMFNNKLMGKVADSRKSWGAFANKAIPGQIATKAGGAASDTVYLRNVALHEMSHVAEGRFRTVASVAQRERLEGLWAEINTNRAAGNFDSLPSLYADENSGEFFAEALSDALIGEAPNPMSLRVAALFDEVFT